MNKLVYTAEDRADMQVEAEIKNHKRKGRKGGREGEKERERAAAWILDVFPFCFCSHKA